ncbi:RusA family crossover junction endodeoxyribonuclease [Hyphomicrobium sp.]|uniref:RusA family crossover junction endodeoxyribonuclease n=1 Tax=Hyphomicrobium sp. TaxID=82 RepID=UPI0025C4E9B1|nr:RusA family crossover junction endodeoxyribonuclease [Hyphomicrobium sp.]MCC7253180.1 RusA family crossover junction endodeoxyribonuclease [Hyphomicrobium sp.]
METEEAAIAAGVGAHVALPVPPSVNRCWRNVRGVGRVRTARYRAWVDEAGWELLGQHPRAIPGPVAITIRAGRPQRRRDLDNVLKPLLDLLVATHVIQDDSFVVALSAAWDDAIASGRCTVTVESIGGAA